MSPTMSMIADHGDAEWVKLIGLAIFAAISLIGGMIKKFAESRKSSPSTQTTAAGPSPVARRFVQKPVRMKSGLKDRKPAPEALSAPQAPITTKGASRGAPRTPDPGDLQRAPLRRDGLVSGLLEPRALRKAVILAEILSPPLAIREIEGG